MKKKIIAMMSVLLLTITTGMTTFAAEDTENALNAFSTYSSEIKGAEFNQTQTYSTNSKEAQAVCIDYLEIDKKFLKKEWRALGETSISGGVTWDIKMELELWKDGHISTTASLSANDTSYYCGATKYVAGDDEDQFAAEGIFRVYDDNNVKIHEKELYVNM